jgi:hypothetical protein
MMCKICAPYGRPGLVATVAPRTPEEMVVPPHLRPPASIIWVPCRHCTGGITSCCDNAGAEGNE